MVICQKQASWIKHTIKVINQCMSYVCVCFCLCVSPLARPGVRHAAHDGGEHESSDKGEKHQVDEALHAVVAEPRQRLDVVLP